MKKIIKYLAIILILTAGISFAKTKMSSEELNVEINKCMVQKTSACFRDLWLKSELNIIRYNYAIMLYQEKSYDKAASELRAFISDSKTEDKYVLNAKKLIKTINERRVDVGKANAQDRGDYLDEIGTYAQWENPLNIKVYLTPSNGKERLFKMAFQTWDTRLIPLHFVFVPTIDNADIICSYTNYIKKHTAGITKYRTRVNYTKNKRYLVPPITIDIATQVPGAGRPYTDAELQSIILHEIGHAIGIPGHSTNKNDIMFFSTDGYKNSQISNRDVNTIKRIYQ